MVHVPKLLKVSAKAVKTNAKAAALSGVAIVQAHPVAATLTVVAIVGVGLAIYYFKNSNRYRVNDLKYSRETMDHDGNSSGYFYDPETKSITSDVPSSNNLDDKEASKKNRIRIKLPSATNLRDSNDATVGESRNVEKLDENFINLPSASNSTGSNDKPLGESLFAQKLDENCVNLQAASNFSDSNDETADESHSVERLDENFIHLQSDSNSPVSNDKPVWEFRSVLKLNKNCVNLPAASNFPQSNNEDAGEYHSVENLNENCFNLLPASNFPGSIDKPAGESCSIQKLDENCISLPSGSNRQGSNDVATSESHSVENFINLPSGSNSYRYWFDVSFSDLTDSRCETSMGTLLSDKSDWCKTCGENPVNTYTQPCNHRYMCGDCARKIFRCKVCHAKIEEVIVEKS